MLLHEIEGGRQRRDRIPHLQMSQNPVHITKTQSCNTRFTSACTALYCWCPRVKDIDLDRSASFGVSNEVSTWWQQLRQQPRQLQQCHS